MLSTSPRSEVHRHNRQLSRGAFLSRDENNKGFWVGSGWCTPLSLALILARNCDRLRSMIANEGPMTTVHFQRLIHQVSSSLARVTRLFISLANARRWARTSKKASDKIWHARVVGQHFKKKNVLIKSPSREWNLSAWSKLLCWIEGEKKGKTCF